MWSMLIPILAGIACILLRGFQYAGQYLHDP